MARGVKGSRAAKKEPAGERKARKPYPTFDERIAMVDAKIKQLEELIQSRAQLIAETEAKLNERKAALTKNQEALEKAKAKKEHLIELKNRPEKPVRPKGDPAEVKARRQEAAAKAREARKAKKAQMEALMEKLAQSGKTIEELMAELEK